MVLTINVVGEPDAVRTRAAHITHEALVAANLPHIINQMQVVTYREPYRGDFKTKCVLTDDEPLRFEVPRYIPIPKYEKSDINPVPQEESAPSAMEPEGDGGTPTKVCSTPDASVATQPVLQPSEVFVDSGSFSKEYTKDDVGPVLHKSSGLELEGINHFDFIHEEPMEA